MTIERHCRILYLLDIQAVKSFSIILSPYPIDFLMQEDIKYLLREEHIKKL